MSDDLVKRICKTWIEDGRSDECFWEGWPENPTPDDSLTPGMVLARIEELEAKLAKAVKALVQMVGKRYYADDPWEIACNTLAELKGETDE
jgi:hypothetical protein